MRRTYCVTQLDMVDVEAMNDVTVSTDDNQSFGNLELFNDYVQATKYGTLALNQYVLDGTFATMDAPQDIAFMSNTKSREDCTFANNPTIFLKFTANHTSAGLTFFFGADYPAEIQVSWYSLSGVELLKQTYNPTSTEYILREQIENYSAIIIEFVKTRHPYQYATLQFIRYGLVVQWERSQISSAKVLEEIDRTSATLSINTATVNIIDTNNNFDIQNSTGLWHSVQKTQKLVITEYYNDTPVNMGTFYVDSFSFSDNTASFSCKDAIGLLDNFTFRSGKVYGDVESYTFSKLIKEIFDSIGNDYHIALAYDIAEELKDLKLSGYLNVMTAREALQMACFAAGAVADDSRDSVIKIYRATRDIKSIVPVGRKFNGETSIKLDTYVSGVSIEIPNVYLDTDSREVYNNPIIAGTSIITFDSPVKPSTIVITDANGNGISGLKYTAAYNYVELTVAEDTNIIIKAQSYAADSNSITLNTADVSAGETANIVEFTGCTLYAVDYLQKHAQYLLDYYALRQTGNTTIILEDEQVAEWITLKTKDSLSQFATCIESASIDLTGGFLATLELRGYSKVVSEYDYAGEIYASQSRLL